MHTTAPSRSSIVKTRNTAPELAVQRVADERGLRYELHRSDLPGTPDLVFPLLHLVVFVNGCFWHSHDCDGGRRRPATNSVFWDRKRRGNVHRDQRNIEVLKKQGWDVMVIWECELKEGYELEIKTH